MARTCGKIAIVTHSYPCFEGDWRSNFIEAQANAYADYVEVTVFVPYVKTWKRVPRATDRVRIVCYRYLPWDGLHTLGVEPIMNRDLGLNVGRVLAIPFLVLVGVWRLARAMRRERFDMAQAHWAVPNAVIALAARFLARAANTKVFTSFPGSDVTVLSLLGPFGRLLARLIATCDYLSCNSSDLKEDLVALGVPADRIRLVIYGVDDATVAFDAAARARVRERLGLGGDVPVLLMVGRFVPKKGFSVGLKALADIVRAAPRTTLLLVGGGPLADEYRAILAQNGCAGQVRFLGYVPTTELPGYYSACDVLLMPSQRVPSDGLNVVALEAMACARPIVASRVGGNDLVVFDGYLHDRDDWRELARRRVELLRDPARRQAMGAASLRLVRERFNWRTIARHYLEQAVVDGAGRWRN